MCFQEMICGLWRILAKRLSLFALMFCIVKHFNISDMVVNKVKMGPYEKDYSTILCVVLFLLDNFSDHFS